MPLENLGKDCSTIEGNILINKDTHLDETVSNAFFTKAAYNSMERRLISNLTRFDLF